MSAIILPRRFQRQPFHAVLRDDIYTNSCIFYSPLVPGRNISAKLKQQLNAGNPGLAGASDGRGVISTTNSTRAYYSDNVDYPIKTKDGVGTGTFSVSIQASFKPSTTRQSPLIVRAGTVTLLTMANGYYGIGGGNSTQKTGTFYFGTLVGGAYGVWADNILDGQSHHFQWTRYPSGRQMLWVDSVQRSTGAVLFGNINTTGMQIAVGGFTTDVADRGCIDPVTHTLVVDGELPITRTAWDLYQPSRQVLYFGGTGAAPRYARPTSDISLGAWTPSTSSDLYPMVDEASADDNDYIYTTTASTCTLGLNAVTDPATSSGQVLTVRCKSAYGNDLIATLKQSSTTIATRTFSSLSSSWENKQIILSGAECDAITDYSALRVDLEAQA